MSSIDELFDRLAATEAKRLAGPKVQLTVRLDPALDRRLRRKAAEEGLSLNAAVALALRRWVSG